MSGSDTSASPTAFCARGRWLRDNCALAWMEEAEIDSTTFAQEVIALVFFGRDGAEALAIRSTRNDGTRCGRERWLKSECIARSGRNTKCSAVGIMGATHGYQHASHHCSRLTSAFRRRLVRPRTLVLNEIDRKMCIVPGLLVDNSSMIGTQ
jgi:hypothetical protein